MKSNSNQKLILIIVVVVILIIATFFILKKQEKTNVITETTPENQEMSIQIIKSKRQKIESLMNEVNSMFDPKTFDIYTQGRREYIDLPIDVGSVGNKYPFGNYSLE